MSDSDDDMWADFNSDGDDDVEISVSANLLELCSNKTAEDVVVHKGDVRHSPPAWLGLGSGLGSQLDSA